MRTSWNAATRAAILIGFAAALATIAPTGRALAKEIGPGWRRLSADDLRQMSQEEVEEFFLTKPKFKPWILRARTLSAKNLELIPAEPTAAPAAPAASLAMIGLGVLLLTATFEEAQMEIDRLDREPNPITSAEQLRNASLNLFLKHNPLPEPSSLPAPSSMPGVISNGASSSGASAPAPSSPGSMPGIGPKPTGFGCSIGTGGTCTAPGGQFSGPS